MVRIKNEDRVTDANCMICNAKCDYKYMYHFTRILFIYDVNMCGMCKALVDNNLINNIGMSHALMNHLKNRTNYYEIIIKANMIFIKFKVIVFKFKKLFKKKNKIATEAKMYE